MAKRQGHAKDNIVVEPVGYHYHGNDRVEMVLRSAPWEKAGKEVRGTVQFLCPVCDARFDADMRVYAELTQ